MAEWKSNGGELMIILILVILVVGWAFFFLSGNGGWTADTGNSINVELPDTTGWE